MSFAAVNMHNDAENDRLVIENEELKMRVSQLEEENRKLKESSEGQDKEKEKKEEE